MPAHPTTFPQVFLAKHHITQVCQPPQQPTFGSLWLLAFLKAKIAIKREICECDGHTIHKLSQRLAAEQLAPQDSDCSQMHSKVSSVWLPSYIKAMQLVLKIFKMAGNFLDSPHMHNLKD